MNELVVTDRATEWRRLKALVLDSVSSPITRRVYNLGLDEFIAWFTRSLTQTKNGLQFKGTKSGRPRRVELPPSILAPLEAHRQRQEKFRQQFGPDYRTDLDLIFANPDGTPLKPDSISAS